MTSFSLFAAWMTFAWATRAASATRVEISRQAVLQLAENAPSSESLLNEDLDCVPCANYSELLAAQGLDPTVVSPVCGADGVTYLDECRAGLCGGTAAICAGECPCSVQEDPASKWCPGVPYPSQITFDATYSDDGMIPNVEWPQECCELCDAEPACRAYSWFPKFVHFFAPYLQNATCFLLDTEFAGAISFFPIAYSGDKLAPMKYVYNSAPVPWHAAHYACLDAGGELASIENADANGALVAAAMAQGWSSAAPPVWTGANDLSVEGTFVWTDGTPFGYTNWAVSSPSNSTPGEDCVELAPGTGKWNDIPCDAVRGYVCEFPNAVPSPLAGADYFRGTDMPNYWEARIAAAGLPVDRFGFNSTEGQWYCDDVPTCVGLGAWNDASCSAGDKRVCAGGATYGYGVRQIDLLGEMMAMGDFRHYKCPDCPVFSSATSEKCDNGVLRYFPKYGSVPPGLDTPGAMSLVDPSQWIECDCTMHHEGTPFLPNSYWWQVLTLAGIDTDRVTYFGAQFYYDEKPTCVARGSLNGACPAGFVCGNGATHGYSSKQMEALQAAIDNTPSFQHPACPGPV